jgi:hypothetical protein
VRGNRKGETNMRRAIQEREARSPRSVVAGSRYPVPGHRIPEAVTYHCLVALSLTVLLVLGAAPVGQAGGGTQPGSDAGGPALTDVTRPSMGALIRGSGGLRKVRWGTAGRGKSGGVRAIYYWAVRQERLLLLLLYAKSERDDLSPEQLRLLRQIVEEEYP